MKPITINVSEPTYRDFQAYARRHDRKASELIREAMEWYRQEKIASARERSLLELEAISVGGILKLPGSEDDLLGEMTNL